MSFLSDRLARGRIHYGWYVAGITFVTLLVAAGIRSMPSILIVPVEQEFGWSRATISFAVAINLILYGLMGPFAAAFMDRLGVRTTILVSLTLVACGVALTPLMTAPWQLVLLWGVVVGTGTGMTALVLGATVVNRWFSEQRGLVMGMLTASTATGQLLFLPLLAMIVEELGWRTAVLGVACAALLIVPLVMLLMRERPRDVGLAPFGKTEMEAAPPRSTANPFAMAFGALLEGSRSRDFWLLFGTFFICGLSTNGLIGTHLIAACFDAGIPEVRAAGLLAMMGDLRSGRHDAERLAVRPLRQPLPAGMVLRAARAVAAVAALRARPVVLRPVAVRRLLRPGLDRHRPADGAAHHQHLRQGESADDVRLDLHRPPARRRRGGFRGRRAAHGDGRLPGSLHAGRAGLPRRGRHVADDRPATGRPRAGGERDGVIAGTPLHSTVMPGRKPNTSFHQRTLYS